MSDKVEIYRLTMDGVRSVKRTYGGPALYESLKAAKSARSQMMRGDGMPRVQQLFAGMSDVDHLVWEDVQE